MKISVICPTRRRKDVLCRGIDSLINSLSSTADVEFLFRFDEDDLSTLEDVMNYYYKPNSNTEFISTLITNKFKWGESTFKFIISKSASIKNNVSMKFLIGHRHHYHYLNRYLDELMYVSDGEYIVNWTDDLELMTNDKYEGWNLLIEEGEGRHYIFYFRHDSHTEQVIYDGFHPVKAVGKPLYPVVFPRKFFEINGRICPNVLDDQWWGELCKILSPNVRVILSWGVHHHCQYHPPSTETTGITSWGHEMDSTCKEGRLVWDHNRESNLKDYEYYNYGEMLKIKEYMDGYPNKNLTTQYHDTSFSGMAFEPGEASGRWGPFGQRKP